jgi:hypothetical protein
MKPHIKRKGKLLKRFHDHPWKYVISDDYCGKGYYRWCPECDRLERLGMIYNGSWDNEIAEAEKEMGVPPNIPLIRYCCHPDEGKDLIQMRIDAGFAKQSVV